MTPPTSHWCRAWLRDRYPAGMPDSVDRLTPHSTDLVAADAQAATAATVAWFRCFSAPTPEALAVGMAVPVEVLAYELEDHVEQAPAWRDNATLPLFRRLLDAETPPTAQETALRLLPRFSGPLLAAVAPRVALYARRPSTASSDSAEWWPLVFRRHRALAAAGHCLAHADLSCADRTLLCDALEAAMPMSDTGVALWVLRGVVTALRRPDRTLRRWGQEQIWCQDIRSYPSSALACEVLPEPAVYHCVPFVADLVQRALADPAVARAALHGLPRSDIRRILGAAKTWTTPEITVFLRTLAALPVCPVHATDLTELAEHRDAEVRLAVLTCLASAPASSRRRRGPPRDPS
jgi:hypothetical protein